MSANNLTPSMNDSLTTASIMVPNHHSPLLYTINTNSNPHAGETGRSNDCYLSWGSLSVVFFCLYLCPDRQPHSFASHYRSLAHGCHARSITGDIAVSENYFIKSCFRTCCYCCNIIMRLHSSRHCFFFINALH